ncbi:hypothetical protein DPMN_097278 [Dreissena polymorpha]|uniref:Uncharacterized protein n=1 Tax=Dreissena polymorpha TaxID=45954 RepID=A0A9D4R4L5_DREPO|nr:hypothetical protein DPMN_097278 [Dreissena polymorpha]
MACPIDGYWTEWTEWSVCSLTCDSGTRDRSRSCIEPKYGGKDCEVGDYIQSELCNTQACPIDSYWTEWTEWNVCTLTCDSGTRDRSRSCIEPKYGGRECEVGNNTQSEPCNIQTCPIDGYWTEWTEWNVCTLTCGSGTRDRSRSCIEPKFGDKGCEVVDNIQSELCNIKTCPIDGYWTEWTAWSVCSLTCDSGTRDRLRSCIEPKYGGKKCEVGDNIQSELCNTQLCPSDGYWTEWTEWSVCSLTCGSGTSDRSRNCIEPQFGGLLCGEGIRFESKSCSTLSCPCKYI